MKNVLYFTGNLGAVLSGIFAVACFAGAVYKMTPVLFVYGVAFALAGIACDEMALRAERKIRRSKHTR